MNIRTSSILVLVMVLLACAVECRPRGGRGRGGRGGGGGGGRGGGRGGRGEGGRGEGERGNPPQGQGQRDNSRSDAEARSDSGPKVRACALNGASGDCKDGSDCDFPTAAGMSFSFQDGTADAVARNIVFCNNGITEADIVEKVTGKGTCEQDSDCTGADTTCDFNLLVLESSGNPTTAKRCKAPDSYDDLKDLFPCGGRGGRRGRGRGKGGNRDSDEDDDDTDVDDDPDGVLP